MGLKPKPIAIAPGKQMRLDGFFKSSSLGGPTPASSSESSTSSNKTSQPPPSKVLSTSPKLTTPSSHSPSPPTALPPKRARDDADDYDDQTVEVRPPPRKSPKISPPPDIAKDSSSHHHPISSSVLSSLNSPTPQPPDFTSSFESEGPHSGYTRQPKAFNTQRPTSYKRPSTNESNRSTMTGSFSSNRTSFPGSSHRIVRNGQEMVRNSDSEGSDDSLVDLDELLDIARPTNNASSPLTELSRTPTPPADDYENRPRRSTRVGRGPTTRRTTPDVEQPKNKLKMNLDSMLARSRKREEEDAKVAEALKAIEDLQSEAKTPSPGPDQERQVLSMIRESGREEEDAGRLLNAISRTDTLVKAKKWSFFDYDQFWERQRKAKITRLNCGDHPAAAFLQDDKTAKDLLVSGYFVHLSRAAPLNTQLIQWLFQHALYDRCADIRSACVDALSSDRDLPRGEVYELVRTELGKLGMKNVMVDGRMRTVTADRMPTSESTEREMNWVPLQQVLRILAEAAPDAGSEHGIEAVCILARMSIDNAIVSDFVNQSLLTAALDRCLAGLFNDEPVIAQEKLFRPNAEVMLDAIHNVTAEDDFRVKILDVLSQSSETPSLARRKLAMAWLYDDATHLKKPIVPFSLQRENDAELFVDIERIRKHMKCHKSVFSINRKTDWAKLRPKMLFMTIAIGNGDPPPFADLASREGLSDERKEEVKKAVKRYNDEVDWFARIISRMFSQVVDKGIEHITRTESKNLLERLSSRLSFCIRTKVPVRNRGFDQDPGNGDIASFMKPAKTGSETPATAAAPGQLTSPPEPIDTCLGDVESAQPKAQSDTPIPVDLKSPAFSARSLTSDYQDAPETINDLIMSNDAEEFHTAPETASS